MSTKIRSSQQLYIDDHLQFNSKKGQGLVAGTASGEAVEFDQLNSAISNAVAGVGSSIHVPVADLAASKAISAAGRADKMLMLIESIGLYHFDAESMSASNDGTVIRPTDVASDAAAGRWIKMSSILTDHALLDNILGNGGYHLSLAERDKLTGIAANANNYSHPNHTGDVTSVGDGAQTIAAKAVTLAKMADIATGSILGRTTAGSGSPEVLTKAQVLAILNVADGAQVVNAANIYNAASGTTDDVTLADADFVPLLSGGILGKFSFTTLKSFLKTYFDTLYNKYVHPNHTGEVTSTADGAQVITNNAVTNAKLADMAANTIKGSVAGGDPADLTKAQALGILNVEDGADVTDNANVANAIAAGAVDAALADTDYVPVHTGTLVKTTFTTIKAFLKLYFDTLYNKYVHPNHSGDVSSTGDGATVIGANKVDNSMLKVMPANTLKGAVGAGNAGDLTVAQVRTMLGLVVGTNLSQRYYRATPAGLVNSSNTVFTIPALVVSGTEEIYKNGLLQQATIDYTISYAATTTITFLTAPSSVGVSDIILVSYSV